jgi:hypothetical protein
MQLVIKILYVFWKHIVHCKIHTNQKQELSVVAMFVNGSELNEHFYRGPPKDASYQVSIHLAKRFQWRKFLKIGQSETRIAYGGHVC